MFFLYIPRKTIVPTEKKYFKYVTIEEILQINTHMVNYK